MSTKLGHYELPHKFCQVMFMVIIWMVVMMVLVVFKIMLILVLVAKVVMIIVAMTMMVLALMTLFCPGGLTGENVCTKQETFQVAVKVIKKKNYVTTQS